MSFQIYHSLAGIPPVARIQVAQPPSPPVSPPPASKAWISDWMELLLRKVAEGYLGPTVTTRWMMLAANMTYNSYAFVTTQAIPIDMKYWKSMSKGDILESTEYDKLEAWMEAACAYFFPILIREWMGLPLVDTDIVKHTRSDASVSDASMRALKVLLNDYMTARDDDGWSNTFIFNGDLPNGTSVIYADNSVNQNLNTELANPRLWTPLSFNGRTRRYLTPEWGTANEGVLPSTAFQELLDSANELFPSDAQFDQEMREVSKITSLLTNDQKMVAEYWAGGPGSVTPPGMWVVFMDVVIRSNGLTQVQEIRNYTVVANGLYQAGICAWRLKRDHLQARPVQMIREFEFDQPIEQSWNDKHLGQYWLPYQMQNFVTPPFPDFLSGHSTFSATAARLFCCLLQSDQIVLKNPMISLEILKYFSPILTNTTNFSINLISLLPGCSEIEPSVVPSTGVTLSWSTWSDMASSSGKSRIYGGIHVESSNQAGLYLGRLIGDKIWDKLKGI